MKVAAIAQLCSTSNKLKNLHAIARCAGFARRGGASMLLLPGEYQKKGTSTHDHYIFCLLVYLFSVRSHPTLGFGIS